MKLLSPERFVDRLNNNLVAVVLTEPICKCNATLVENTVSRWLTNVNTIGTDHLSLSYKPATKDYRTLFHVGKTYFDMNGFVCFEGDNGLMFAINQSTIISGGVRQHHAILVVFDIKKEV